MTENSANPAGADAVGIDFDELRRDVDALLGWACGGGAGRAIDDPVYRSIASNAAARAAGLSLYELSKIQHWDHPFSSCAFLAHWLLETLGVLEPWVGRESHGTNPLTRLAYTAPQSRNPKPDEVLQCGDVILIGHDAHTWHIQCAISHDPDGGILMVAEYGQEPLLGGHVASKTMRRVGAQWMVGERPLERVLPLEDVINAAAAAGKLAGAIAWPEACPHPEAQAG